MKKIFTAVAVFVFFVAAPACLAQPAWFPAPGEEPVHRVIYMIGDGMGVAHITALMLDDEEQKINMERATAVGLVKTRSANNRVTDSSAAGTALASGHKTNNSRLGIDTAGNRVRSIMDFAAMRGWKRGLVATSRIQHATPAAFYAHVWNRSSYDSIAVQFLESGIDVAMGGGRSYFERKEREDRRNLIKELRDNQYNVTYTLEEAEAVDSGRVVALLADKDMEYSQDGRTDYLPRATQKAIALLEHNSTSGRFFLMVEGSMIDYAAHDNDIERTLSEMRDFDQAVGIAFDYADRNPGTLVIVTADHETGGLSMPSANSDYTAGGDIALEYEFGSGGHTASMVPLFAYGAGAEYFSHVMDNTDVPMLINTLMHGPMRVRFGRGPQMPGAEAAQ